MLKPGEGRRSAPGRQHRRFHLRRVCQLHRSRVKVHINDRSFTLRDKDIALRPPAPRICYAQVQGYEKHYCRQDQKSVRVHRRRLRHRHLPREQRAHRKSGRNHRPQERHQQTRQRKDPHRREQFQQTRRRRAGRGQQSGPFGRCGGGGDKTTGTTEKTETEYTVTTPSREPAPSTTAEIDPTGVSVLFPRSASSRNTSRSKTAKRSPIRPSCSVHRRAAPPQGRDRERLRRHAHR